MGKYMNLVFYNKMKEIIEESRIYVDEPMKKHTTFRVGGPADYFVTPKAKEEVKELISLCKEFEVPYYVLGNGSNLLVSDKGYRGVIIQIYKEMNQIQLDGENINVQAGALLSRIGNVALEAELSGFEFAAGIPGQPSHFRLCGNVRSEGKSIPSALYGVFQNFSR